MNKSPGAQITSALLERPALRRFDITVDRKAAGPMLVYPSTAETVRTVQPGPSLPLRMRDLIPGGTTIGDGVLYVRETSITNSPIVPVVPGAVKPAADMTYEVVLSPVSTIAGYLKLPAQYWEDFTMLESWMDTRLMYSLSSAEEKQLLNGNGVAPNLQGFMLVAIAVTPAAAGLLEGVAAGIAAVYGREYIVDGIVLNPSDWGKALTKVGTGGGYTMGGPAQITAPLNLWGFPVVLSSAQASGSYLVGQFNPFSQIFDRDPAAVEVADQNQDDFIKNMVTMRAEERLALAIYQPGAFAKGTFTP